MPPPRGDRGNGHYQRPAATGNGAAAPADHDHDKDKQIFVCALLKEFIRAGKVELDERSLANATNMLNVSTSTHSRPTAARSETAPVAPMGQPHSNNSFKPCPAASAAKQPAAPWRSGMARRVPHTDSGR